MSARRSLWIPWAIGALAAFMLVGAVVLSVVAGGSDPGLVAGSPARLAGTSLTPTGLSAVLELRVLARGADGAVVVEARLRGPDGRARRVEVLDAVLHRVTHAREDRPVAFSAHLDGSWRATVRPAEGPWDLAVQARGEAAIASATLRL